MQLQQGARKGIVMEKLYVVVRADLQPGAQIAQSCHALSAFAVEHTELFYDWQIGSSNLVCLQIPDAFELAALLARADAMQVKASSFHEPDFDNELTAAAFEADAFRILSCLPLALRQKAA